LEGLGIEVGTIYDHFEYFVVIWYILCPFGMYILGCCNKKNLANLWENVGGGVAATTKMNE
jgi:hypothetical protein